VASGLSHQITASPLSVMSTAIAAVILVSPSSAHIVQTPYDGTKVWPAGQSSQLEAGHGGSPSQPCCTPSAQNVVVGDAVVGDVVVGEAVGVGVSPG
jgi:hypothetical protein